MMLSTYRLLTSLGSPGVYLLLRKRLKRGKEDRHRLPERFGKTLIPRPRGTLMWLHAASVGESVSLLPLLRLLREEFPQLHLLMTTGTVTSAQLMASRLPAGVIHQFVPVDTPRAVERFMEHWQPEIALWAESELWPNLVLSCYERGCHMMLAGGRMSQRSYTRWQRMKSIIRPMLEAFEAIFAQSEGDAQRFMALGGHNVWVAGNLKFDAAPLEYDPSALSRLTSAIGDRPVWLAASTHPGEEEIIVKVHTQLAPRYPGLLTIIVPRHAERGPAIAQPLRQHVVVSLRSRSEAIAPETGIYIADTMGELGLFYWLCKIAFIGGSLVPHGGQNMLEAVRLGSAVISGPYTHNFADIAHALQAARGMAVVDNATQLANKVAALLDDPAAREVMAQAAFDWLSQQQGATDIIFSSLRPVLAQQLARGKAA